MDNTNSNPGAEDKLELVFMKPVPRRPGTIVVGDRRSPGFKIPSPSNTDDCNCIECSCERNA